MGRKGRKSERDRKKDYVKMLQEEEMVYMLQYARQQQPKQEKKRKREEEEAPESAERERPSDEDLPPAKRRNLGTGAFNIGAEPKPLMPNHVAVSNKKHAKHLVFRKKIGHSLTGPYLNKTQRKEIKRRERKLRRAKEKALGC